MDAQDIQATARRAIPLVDLTDLDDSTTTAAVGRLCERALEHGTAAVCVWPDFVAESAAMLAGSPVTVATVVDFPTGDERAHAVRVVTARALEDGADEIDVVLPYRAFVAGDEARAAAVVDGVRAEASGALMKVILETGALHDVDVIARAARFAIDHGADFVKTSTGKTSASASLEAVRTMLLEIRESGWPVGIKPSGGIRTLADASAYLALADEIMGEHWAAPDTFRFGASGLLDALEAAIEGDATVSSDATY